MRTKQDLKPTPPNWKVVLGIPMLLVALLFPLFAGSSNPGTMANAAVGTSDVPRGTSEVERNTSDVPRTSLYNTDVASSLQVVVNKQRPLNPVEYLPKGKVQIGYSWVVKPAGEAYAKLKAAVSAQKLGTLCINSGYRSFSSQKLIHDAKVAQLGKIAGEKLAARPGYSEHQTGLAMDISTTQLGCRIGSFGASKAAKWIAANAWQFGFVVRYPNGKTDITGYVWEPWHLRFVGVDLATDMQVKKIATLEEYFGLAAAPKY
jgi:D-alanyl-D-alanine carboxypeptidase